MENYLSATRFFDYHQPELRDWLAAQLQGVPEEPVEQIKALYLAIRDGFAYNPYVFRTAPETFSASHALAQGETYCIPKAVLLGAGARAIGIPSRLGLADVRNHLSSPRLIEWLRSDIFCMHGYIELYLNDRWVKATPAFDAALCDRMGVAPLAFDGVQDSVFQAFTGAGEAHMEYVRDHGVFEDVPQQFIVDGVRTAYPHLFPDEGSELALHGSLTADLDHG